MNWIWSASEVHLKFIWSSSEVHLKWVWRTSRHFQYVNMNHYIYTLQRSKNDWEAGFPHVAGKDLRWFYTSFLQIITVFHGVFQISDSFLVPFGLHGRTNKQRPASNITAFPKPKLPCSIWIPSRPRSFGKKAEKSLGFPLLRGS